MRAWFVLLIVLLVTVAAPAQETGTGPEQAIQATPASPSLEISSHSGNPLLLDLTVIDPQTALKSVLFESPVSEAIFRIAPDADRESVHLSLVPFMQAGVYDFRVEMRFASGSDGAEERVVERTQIGFVDYVFGRDNMRFGNNADYESVIGTYGEILAEWIDDRFGDLDDASLVPLIDYMYGVFGKRSGRCYAFAGSEVRFWLWPDLLPSYYDEAYDLRPGVHRIQRQMNYLQLDMAYNHFITGGYALDPESAAAAGQVGLDVIREEVWRIMARIAAGEPVAVGFIGPQLHHAMLVYGYIRRPDRGFVDLLVSNNWKSDQDLNLRSRNAEAIRVFLEPSAGEPVFEWHYVDGVRDREIERLFIVEVLPEYHHDRETLENLVAERLDQLRREGRAIIVVEEADGVWLTNGEQATGRRSRQTVEELEGVLYDKVNDTYRFEFPANQGLWLELTDRGGARVLHYHPGDTSGADTAWIEEMPEPADGSVAHRRVDLQSDRPEWEIVSAPE